MRLGVWKLVRDGKSMLFWYDIWNQNISLAGQFPNLYQKAKFTCSLLRWLMFGLIETLKFFYFRVHIFY
jgi:hypothetical protein